jgi:tetratricopeptide (TPR) repeat protein
MAAALALWLSGAALTAQEPNPPVLTPEEQKLAAGATKLDRAALQLYLQGKSAEAVAPLRQSLEIRRKLYPAAKYPDGHPDIAQSLNNMGAVLLSSGSAHQALPFYEQALAMRRRLYPAPKYPDGHPDIAQSLNSMGNVLVSVGLAEKALPFFEQALAMRRRLDPVAK